MIEAPDPSRREITDATARHSVQTGAPTVASLRMQVRLVPIDADRESKLARLIASGETLRLEWESLFQQIVELLNNDVRSVQDSDSSSHPTDR
jgi:hypothetical protein